jgi:hypothetical protein
MNEIYHESIDGLCCEVKTRYNKTLNYKKAYDFICKYLSCENDDDDDGLKAYLENIELADKIGYWIAGNYNTIKIAAFKGNVDLVIYLFEIFKRHYECVYSNIKITSATCEKYHNYNYNETESEIGSEAESYTSHFNIWEFFSYKHTSKEFDKQMIDKKIMKSVNETNKKAFELATNKEIIDYFNQNLNYFNFE